MSNQSSSNNQPGSNQDRVNGPAAKGKDEKFEEVGQVFEVRRRDQNFTTPECTDHSRHVQAPSQRDDQTRLSGAGRVEVKEEFIGQRFEVRRKDQNFTTPECTNHSSHVQAPSHPDDQTRLSGAGRVDVKEEFIGQRFEVRRKDQNFTTPECTNHSSHVQEPTYPDRRLFDNQVGQQVNKAKSKEAIIAADTPYQKLARRGGSRTNLIQPHNLEQSANERRMADAQIGKHVHKVQSREAIRAQDTDYQNLARRGGSRSNLFAQDNIDSTKDERRLVDQQVGSTNRGEVHRSRETLVSQDTEYQRLARRGGSRSNILGQEPKKN